MGNDGIATVGLGATTRESNGLTYTLVATSSGPPSVSTLSFTVSDLLNGRNITCGEPGQAHTMSQAIMYKSCCVKCCMSVFLQVNMFEAHFLLLRGKVLSKSIEKISIFHY